MNKLAHFIVHSKAAAYIAALLYVCVWVLRTVGQGGAFAPSGYIGLLLSLIVGYLSVKVGRELSFIDARNVLPATLFFMGCAIVPQLESEPAGYIQSILYPAACYTLLRTYRDRSAMGSYFMAFVLIGVACLQAPPLLLTLPLTVVCGAFMESLHGRTFFAALWGLLSPYWVAFCVLFLTDRIDVIPAYLGSIALSRGVGPGLSQVWAEGLWMLLLALSGSVTMLLHRGMKLQAKASYRLLMVALLVLLVTVAISPGLYLSLRYCVLLYVSLIGSTLFVGNSSRSLNIFLLLLFIFWLAIVVFQVWSSFTTH